MDLRTDLGRGLVLRNPIVAASGCCGYGTELTPFYSPEVLGAIVGKTITRAPREGNPSPRMAETPAGMLNSIGLQNPGIERYLERLLPDMQALGEVPVVANVAGEDAADFAALTERVGEVPGVAAVELNISCPNVSHGLDFARVPERTTEVVRACRERTDKPLWAKLSPNVADLRPIAEAAQAGGADAITVSNTLLGMAVDWRARRPKLARGFGGLSGPAIRPVVLLHARRCVEAVDIPVLGCGGVRTAEDALEYLCVGCKAVQVGTAGFQDPLRLPTIVERLGRLLAELGCSRLADYVGSYRAP
ncbi:MAG: dihydroorotate dehydrogenase [Planctomycetota bacterium]|nr:MAG: dihydroorotate dehydrogenase [Planctomycetota bacterium]